MYLITIALLTAAIAAAQPIRDLQYREGGPARFALVIGNSNYGQAPLRNPANDAVAMYQMLTTYQFQTTSLLDASLRDMDAAIDRFVSQLRPNDVALLYHAGHGFQVEGENYLAPVDFRATTEVDAKYSAYPVSKAQEKIERSGARLAVLILDACRNNPFRVARSGAGGLAPPTSRPALTAPARCPCW